MTISYKRRKKAIRAEKKRLEWTNFIDPVDFCYLQANWTRLIDGPPIGTLEELINEQN